MNNKNAKTATGSIVSGFLNQLNHLDGDVTVSALYSARNRSKNQRLCPCGQIIPQDEVIFLRANRCEPCRSKSFIPAPATILSNNHRKIRLEPCPVCLFAFGRSKMRGDVCTECSGKDEVLPRISPQIFTQSVLANFLNGHAMGEAR